MASLDFGSASGGGGAPVDATYILQGPDGDLPGAQALSLLGTGLLKNTTGAGVLSIAGAADLPDLSATYLTLSAAAATYQPIGSYLVAADLSPYLTSAGAAATYQPLGSYATLIGAEVLTNKTLTTPTIASFANAGHTHLDVAGGGALTAAAISDLGAAAVAFTNKTGNISQWSNDASYTTLAAVAGVGYATLTGVETLTNKTLTAPVLGVATATSINKLAITAPATSATLVIADGKTLTCSNSLMFAGTDGRTMTFPTTNATIARTDAAQTFTGSQTIAALVGPVTITEAVGSSGLTITGATQTSSFPALNITQTWNAVGTTFKGASIRITDTTSAAGSLAFEVVGGASASTNLFTVRKDGALTGGISGQGSLDAFTIGATKLRVTSGATFEALTTGATVCSTATLGWSSTATNANTGPDTMLYRGGAAATIQMGADVNGAAVSQTLWAASGITGTDRTGGNLTIASGKGTGAGAVSSLIFQTPTVLATGTTAQSLATRLTLTSAAATFAVPADLSASGIATGILNNGSGVKHARVTTGSVAGGSTALVTVTWSSAFSNANYSVAASVVEATTSSLSMSVVHIESVTASAVTVRVLNNAVTSLTGEVDVIAIHD